jgi:uncharacterized protein
MPEENESFLGTGWGFPPNFVKGLNSVQMISGEEDIRSSLEILLSTSVRERIMQPTYGCDLSKLLFEPIDTTLRAYIKDLINDAVLYHEPRIILDDVTLDTSDSEEGMLKITLEYTVTSTNTRYNYVYPFYLNEGTNIQK